jgi:hypothetical protein
MIHYSLKYILLSYMPVVDAYFSHYMKEVVLLFSTK